MKSPNEGKLSKNQLIAVGVSRGDSGYQSETRTSPEGDPDSKNDRTDTPNKGSDSSSSSSNGSLSPDETEDDSVKSAQQNEYIVLNLGEEPKDNVNSSDCGVESSSSDGTTTRRRMSFGGLCTISEDTPLVRLTRVDENGGRPEFEEVCESAPRKISLMELEAQSEQRWSSAHNSLSEVLRTSYPEKETLDLVKFQNVFRKEESLSALFSLFDWQGTGHINQELFVDTVKGRTSREPGSREWSELLEVLAYVVCGEEGDITEDLLHKILSSKGVLEKLFRLLNKESDGCVSREEIMDFIANLTYARPRTGFTRDNLEWLEKLFRQALGHKQELSFEDFKKIVHSRNSFFAERVFQIFDRDKSGTVSLSEFLGAMQQFAGQSPNDKFKFLFRVYDLDGDGLIQQSELQKVLQACMEENGMKFSKEQIEDLTLAMFEDADTENQGEITYEALKAQLEKHDGLLENLSISIDRWLVPPQPTEENISFLGKLQKLKPYQLSLPYIKNNYVYLSFLLVYCCVNLSLFISRAVEYRESNGFTIIARACGQCLNFNCMFTLVLMLRQTITFLRTHGAGSFLPLDQHMYLHKMVGWVIFLLSLLHALMHLCNFCTILVYDVQPGGVNEFNCTLTEMLLTECPQKLGLVKGWANPTGIILTIILAVMVLCSQPFVRKSGYFEVFYWTHLLYIVFFTLTILHGPNFWKWFVVPGVIFLVERTYRSVGMRTGRGKTYISSGVLLPSKVINLVLQRPAHFHFHPGDYVFVNIPVIAKYEWHPFTVSSAPEQDGALWLHIRAVGEWTNRLHSYFEQQQHRCERPTEVSPASKALPEPPSPRPLDSLPMVAITEEPDTDAAAGSNPSTPQRKKAIINFGFEADPDDTLGNPATNEGVTMTTVPAGCSGPGTSATVVLRKPQPQKIQSTPNFFVNKIAEDKKILDRSTSVPNFYQKKNKEGPKIIPAHPRRTTSERRFDRTSVQRAQQLAYQDALLEARFLNSADRSVAQTFRYMRVKPTVITLDMPNDEDDSNPNSSDFTDPDHAADAVESRADQATGKSPKKKNPKHVTVVTVESPVVKRANGHNTSSAENTLAIPGSESETEEARARRKSQETAQRSRMDSRRTRRISRLEEAEALGQCIGQPLAIFIDGPYGAPSSHIFRAQHAVLIATGIGVTPFASILQSIMHKYWKARHACPKCKHSWTSDIPQTVMNLCKVDFFWINRDQRSFEWFVNLLSQLEIEQAEQGGVLDRFLDMHMYITSALQKTDMKAVGLQLALDLLHEKGKRDLITGLKTRTNAGRPNWDKVFKQLKSQNKGRITVFYCGPPALGRTLRYKCDEYGFNFRKEIF